ncbi:MAG: VCBS repeat-containing protein [Proteobacteria bacterium]|nr:VCBS repeat-containing protein [Pseudomonadota bacterium]
MNRSLCLFSTVLLLSFSFGQLWADEDHRFKRQNLKVNGEIIEKMYEDLDGDSLVDVLIFYLEGEDENTKRMVGLFKQQTDSGFDTIPHQVFELDRKASVVDMADLDKNGKKELLFLAGDGVYYYSLNGGGFNEKPSLLFSTTNFLPSPEEDIMIWDFCPDFEDEDELVIVPQMRGYDIWSEESQGEFVRKSKLRFKPDISLNSSSGKLDQDRGSIRLSYKIPGLIFTDYNKDEKEDILILGEDKMYVFLSKGDALFQEEADEVIAWKSNGEEEEQDFQIEDINGDGIIDLVLNVSGGDLEKGVKSKTSIYLGKGATGFDLDSPHQIISSEKEASGVLLCDLNGDGRKEMIMPSMGFSIGSVVKMLVTKSFKFNLYIRSLGKDDIYPDKPNQKMKLSFKVSFGGSDDFSGIEADDFSGDFNGDGLNDFFYVAGDNVLRFFLGSRGDFFTDKPQYKMGIEIPASRHKIIDFNNDNKSDIVFSFANKEDLKNKIVILFSRM